MPLKLFVLATAAILWHIMYLWIYKGVKSFYKKEIGAWFNLMIWLSAPVAAYVSILYLGISKFLNYLTKD